MKNHCDSCSERIVNARISEVWFGIEDKNPKVDHGGVEHMDERGVSVHHFDQKFHKEIEDANKKFMTWANLKNEEAQAEKSKPQEYLNKQAAETNLDSLSDEALDMYLLESKRTYTSKSDPMLQELKEMGLLEFDDRINSYVPSGNAILLFGKNPRNTFPQAAVKAKVHYGDGTTGTETFKDALVLVPDQVEDWLKKVLPANLDRSKFKAQQVPSFPVKVIREAIINALAHRDYTIEGAKIQLEVHPDRIIVKSPGKPAPPITLDSLKNFTATSYSRNKRLTFILNEMGYMEELGLGMETFKSIREDYDLPLPVVDFDGLNIVTTFPRTNEAAKVATHGKNIEKLTDEELQGFEFVVLNKIVKRKEYEDHFGFDKKKAERHLSKLVNAGLIERKGSGPSTFYELIATPIKT